MSNPLKTTIADLIKEGGKYAAVYNSADDAVKVLKDEDKILISKTLPMWKEVFEQFTIDELAKHSEATKDRIEKLISIHGLTAKSEVTIAGMDYNTLSQFSADDEVPETLRKIRENIH